jgi:hypothetical protein
MSPAEPSPFDKLRAGSAGLILQTALTQPVQPQINH